LTFQDRHHRPLYALRIQTAAKASLPADPERPKRPLSSYMRFAAAKRSQGMKSMSEIGAAWKSASAADKQPFEQAAAADTATYRTEFDKYKASGKLDAWKRDPERPTRPSTAFMTWAQKERTRPDISALSVSEAAKKLGAEWAKVPAAQKEPLETKFKADNESYKVQLQAYKNSGKEAAWLEKTGRLELQKKADAKKQAEKDKIAAAKAKKQAQKAAQAAKAKAVKLKAAKTRAAKAAAAKARVAKAKAAKAAAAKAKAAKAKAEKAAKAKAVAAAAKAKARAKAITDKERKAAALAASRERARKAKEVKAARAKALKEKLAKAKEAKRVAAKLKAAKAKAAAAKKKAQGAAKAQRAKAGKKQLQQED